MRKDRVSPGWKLYTSGSLAGVGAAQQSTASCGPGLETRCHLQVSTWGKHFLQVFFP